MLDWFQLGYARSGALCCVNLYSVFVWGDRLLNTTVVLSTGTLLLLNTKVVFVSFGSEHLQAK